MNYTKKKFRVNKYRKDYMTKMRAELRDFCMDLINREITEKWRFLNGYEDKYLVTIDGDVFSLPRLRGSRRSLLKLKPGNDSRGYLSIKLPDRMKRVHRIVAETFIQNPHGKKCVNHKDGQKLNNHVSNLEWATHSENNKHAYSFGLKKMTEIGKKSLRSKRIKERILNDGDCANIIENRKLTNRRYDLIAKEFDVSPMTVWRVVNKYSKGLFANE